MLDANKSDLLKSAIQSGKASLFLGAGFSYGAKNVHKEIVPNGLELKNKLWDFIGLEGKPTETDSLKIVYELALKKTSKDKLTQFLKDLYQIKEMPSWMSILPTIMWRKIITTNIDDSIQKIYKADTRLQELKIVDGLRDDFIERDSTFSELLCIALHGTMDGLPDEVTFGNIQYAERSNRIWEPWYHNFIYEYCNYPMIMVGTELEEPVMWQYIAARTERFKDEDLRPRSFLVTPTLSIAKKEYLENYKITHIPATGEEFFKWLDSLLTPRPTKLDVIKLAAPQLLPIIYAESKGVSPKIADSITKFFNNFHFVEKVPKDAGYRTNVFHSGAIPTWQDIAHDLDAERAITKDLVSYINEGLKKSGPNINIVHGPAGSGKSTIARRLAWTLTSDQTQILINESGQIPNLGSVREALEFIGGTPVLMIDDAHKSFGDTIKFVNKLVELQINAHVVLFMRSGSAGVFIDELEQLKISFIETPIGELTRNEIKSIISVLDKSKMLGKLQGMSEELRVHEFEIRAKKQLLVAMKEATRGEGFDLIIKTEYDSITPDEARMIYLMASLVTAYNHSLPKSLLIGAFDLPAIRCMNFLKRELRNLVIEVDASAERFIARHQVIAESTIDKAASKTDLLQCYLELLKRLIPTLGKQHEKRSRSFRLYKSLISHEKIISRFGKSDKDSGRKIYDLVSEHMKNDYHYWLQYANFELEIRELSLAQTYIDAAQSLCDSIDPFIVLTKSKIGLHRAIEENDPVISRKMYDESNKDLFDLIQESNSQDAYPYHVYATGLRIWAKLKETDRKSQLDLIKKATQAAEMGLRQNPRDKRLKELADNLRSDTYYIGTGLNWPFEPNNY